MKLKSWKEFLYPYEQTVSELIVKFEALSEEYKRSGQYSPIESVYGRVKKVSSIMDKASRKGISFADIENKVEDIAGIRILCRFVEDIAKVILLIRQRNKTDLVILEERDYVTNTKPSGYRSYHIIVDYFLNTVSGPRTIKAEIQIRTLAMNFWASAEHSIKYKYSGNIPEELKQRLINCAEASYNLDTEMSTIRNEIMHAQKLNQIKGDLVTEILENIQKLHFVAKLEEMNALNKQFIDIWEDGNIGKLREFNNQLNVLAEMYRV